MSITLKIDIKKIKENPEEKKVVIEYLKKIIEILES